jgi:hypothetical protein
MFPQLDLGNKVTEVTQNDTAVASELKEERNF